MVAFERGLGIPAGSFGTFFVARTRDLQIADFWDFHFFNLLTVIYYEVAL